MIRLNGKTHHISQEDQWDGDDDRRERILDNLAIEVGQACDRFLESRKLRRQFKEFWRELRGKQITHPSKESI